MKTRKSQYSCLTMAVVGMLIAVASLADNTETRHRVEVTEPDSMPMTENVWQDEVKNNPEEFLYERLLMEGIEEPDIVYAIAKLETGNFTSRICVEDNNLFGLYDSANKCYYKFDDWRDSVKAYKELVESKYKGGDYYKFLKNLPYSEDADYISKVKALVANIKRI